MNSDILVVSNLGVDFLTGGKKINALQKIDFSVRENEVIGLVGESGCGKSVSCMAVLRILGETAIISGSVRYKGKELLDLPESEIRKIRGKEISMIFQDPVISLNPVKKIGSQLLEIIHLHSRLTGDAAVKKTISLLEQVGIANPFERLNDYPHLLSGGLCQRVMIAMALAGDPKILIADEPTTALDVTVQAQILQLLKKINQERGMATILITHDLGVIAENVDRVFVLYAGLVVEEAPVDLLFSKPAHPYTSGLLKSLPRMTDEIERPLIPIEGVVPAPGKRPPGCCFQPRCSRSTDICLKKQPKLERLGSADHKAACFHADI
ncbi:MAG: ABC transporter ATP-binding protein [Spirochaetia bacterium]|jgi:oligopeptide/dipeptide ABC transporter ATP-binding protein|nr:ABC transporter ATP-binding protein [Spirochaetia bacterium]